MVMDISPNVHVCDCRRCQEHPRSKIARSHRAINRLLATCNERIRRLIAGFLAGQNPGGASYVARVTGLHRRTIARGRRELDAGLLGDLDQIRRPGGGRKPTESRNPGS